MNLVRKMLGFSLILINTLLLLIKVILSTWKQNNSCFSIKLKNNLYSLIMRMLNRTGILDCQDYRKYKISSLYMLARSSCLTITYHICITSKSKILTGLMSTSSIKLKEIQYSINIRISLMFAKIYLTASISKIDSIAQQL